MIRSRRRQRESRTLGTTPGVVCNICSAPISDPATVLHREEPSCPVCRSNVRFRSVIAALSLHFHGVSLALEDFPSRPELVGVGMSDWEGYAVRLRRSFGYDNTYFDEQTRLDIMAPVPHALASSCDFVVSSDVLEHVVPPYQSALRHVREMLKPGGLLVLTVPMRSMPATDEHFPDLHQWDVVMLGSERVLVNRTATGELQVFGNLVYHGGPGVTLEMRVFGRSELVAALGAAGFVNVREFDRPIPEHGIEWIEDCTWPILAEVPR